MDGIDIHNPLNVPGVKERGYADPEKLARMKRKLQAANLNIYRVTLPETPNFFRGKPEGEKEVENLCKTIMALGEASIPIARPLLRGTPGVFMTHIAEHRGGYKMRAYDLHAAKKRQPGRLWDPKIPVEEYWSRCIELYRTMVPVAEDSGVKIALHPSDPPVPEAPFTTEGWRRILEAVPSKNNGLLYCVGTRYEAGGTRLVFEEIQRFGREGKIFEVHLRNVKGSLPASGRFEEVAIDDGDMNMLQILQALQENGFDGPVNPDHVPLITGDTQQHQVATAYAVGYIKALLSVLESR